MWRKSFKRGRSLQVRDVCGAKILLLRSGNSFLWSNTTESFQCFDETSLARHGRGHIIKRVFARPLNSQEVIPHNETVNEILGLSLRKI
jgi:hypothetical protein